MNSPQQVRPVQSTTFKQVSAGLGILIVTAIWGGAFVFMKIALANLSPFWLLFFRFGMASLFLALLCGKRLAGLRLWMLKPALLVGGALFIGFGLHTIGLSQTTASNAAFITSTYVVFVPLIGWLYTRKIGLGQIFFALLALAGIAVISITDQFKLNPGDLWTCTSAMVYALHMLLLGHYTRKMDTMLLTLLQLLVCAVLSGICGLIFETLPQLSSFSHELWLSLLYCSILGTSLCYYVQTAAQKLLSSNQAAVIFTAECLFGAFFGWLILDEMFSGRQLVGALILFSSIIGVIVQPILQQKKAALAAQRIDKVYTLPD